MKPIETLHLFPKLTKELLAILKEINKEDWLKPSPIKERTVKDLVSHLIDSSLRRLSVDRDHFTGDSLSSDISAYDDLVYYIQRINKEWMLATNRLSPRILTDLFEYAEAELLNFFQLLDPFDKAIFSVQWAGEKESENWFDIAREYTEKWHHQMQIRMALEIPLLMEPAYIEPLYNTFMLGLPHHYRNMNDYELGETLVISITGNLNKSWTLQRDHNGWRLVENLNQVPKNNVIISEKEAWKIFTNTDRDKEKYKLKIEVSGEKKLAYKILDFVTVLS